MPRFGLLAAILVAAPSLFGSRAAFALCAQPGDPDCVIQRGDALTGTVDFFATGASFTLNTDQDDRPDELLIEAEVTVAAARIPARANLLKAYLYYGGSLFQDNDGNDEPDLNVELRLPGSDTYVDVMGEQLYESGPIDGFPELTLFTVRADITDEILAAGATLPGTYAVRSFDGDIFYDLAGDPEHTAANASFSIVLIFEEARLPPRTIVLFDGMQEVLGSTVTLELGGFLVSPVPSGDLTFYALEGDCHPGPDDCDMGNNLAGAERIRVQGSDPTRRITLQDAVNPPNDIFNRTINTVDPPRRDETGTDIDTFDISAALRPADEEVTVEITTPAANANGRGELIGLAYVVVGIDVFLPELRIDSRIEVQNESGQFLDAYYPGDPLRVAYAISNTGNLPGTGVRVEADLPANVRSYTVLEEPEGSTVTSDPEGGAFGRGRVVVDNLSVRHGEVSDLVLLVETDCPLPDGGELILTASVSAAQEGGLPFSMDTTVPLLPRDRCGPRFYLYGGRGCQMVEGPLPAGGLPWASFLGLLALLAIRRRRHLASVLASSVAVFMISGCSGDIEVLPDQDTPGTIGVECRDHPGMVVVPSIRGRLPFCIDQFEARIDDTGAAVSERFVTPSREVTWERANNACAQAGKRLCKADEWLTACRGDRDLTYPYGDVYEPARCNDYVAHREDVVETGAMVFTSTLADATPVASGCVTQHGVYDISGNLWEWNATAYVEDKRRGLAGGGFDSNANGLQCVTEDAYAEPDEVNDAYGFRCCADLP